METPVLVTLFKKEALAQMFSWEFCKMFKNTFFYRAPPVAAFELLFLDIKLAHIYPSFLFPEGDICHSNSQKHIIFMFPVQACRMLYLPSLLIIVISDITIILQVALSHKESIKRFLEALVNLSVHEKSFSLTFFKRI